MCNRKLLSLHVGCQTDHSTATTATVISTTTTGSTTTSTDPGDQNQRDNSVLPIGKYFSLNHWYLFCLTKYVINL